MAMSEALVGLLEARLAASKRLAAYTVDRAELQLRLDGRTRGAGGAGAQVADGDGNRAGGPSECCAQSEDGGLPLSEVAPCVLEWLDPLAVGRLACTCRTLRELVRLSPPSPTGLATLWV